MSRHAEALAVMQRVLMERHQAGVTDRQQIADAIDAAYPFSERRWWPYRAWLAARREFFSRHSLPNKSTRRAADKSQAVLI